MKSHAQSMALFMEIVSIALLTVHVIMLDKLTVPQIITLGAIATATAPEATFMVVRQYKAKGPLTCQNPWKETSLNLTMGFSGILIKIL